MGEDIAVIWRWEVTCSEQKAVDWYQHYELSVYTSLLVSSPDPGILDQVRDLGRKMASCFLLGMLASGEWVCVYITYVCARILFLA